jgi:hypothetical protein
MGIKGLAKLLSDEAPDVRVFVFMFVMFTARLSLDSHLLFIV